MSRYEHVGLVFRSLERTALVYSTERHRWQAAYLDGKAIHTADTLRELLIGVLDKDPDLAEVLANRVLMSKLTHEFD